MRSVLLVRLDSGGDVLPAGPAVPAVAAAALEVSNRARLPGRAGRAALPGLRRSAEAMVCLPVLPRRRA
ncbi:MAG TPA: hypothetical protein VKV35_02670 [Streptosporangiaceae bacterium]|jgi:hypothetical protein|nr:hypothetical protein [Streptosporangiaceae bacterium]